MDTNNSRPAIPSAKKNELMSKEETFQNEILRPIIKMKHELLIAYFREYLLKSKHPFAELSTEKRISYLQTVFGQDSNLRSELRGIVISQFSTKEYANYVLIKNPINKRMISIIKERIIDHVGILAV